MPLSLQASGLTGRRVMSPLKLSTLGSMMRTPTQSAPAAPQSMGAAIVPDTARAVRPADIGSGGSAAPGMTGGVPNELPDQGAIDFSKHRGTIGMAALGAAAGFPAGPGGVIVGGALGAVKGLAGEYIGKGVKKFVIDPAKDALGLGPDSEGQRAVHDAFKSYSEKGLGNGLGEAIGGKAPGSGDIGDPNPFGIGIDSGWFDEGGGGWDDNVSDTSSPGPGGGGYG